ncbi:hypothetical protein [uncultured Shewanella sp.]|uniref:hypothetical protein n=1 Tax=uncultured Shewanella sp. TaxID=173975 RepID=UPI002627F22A|nr:hypothetical protein [uncultured Shewanella sp.]
MAGQCYAFFYVLSLGQVVLAGQETPKQGIPEQEILEQKTPEQEILEQEILEQEISGQEISEQEIPGQEILEQEILEQKTSGQVMLDDLPRLTRKPWDQRLDYVLSLRRDIETITMPQETGVGSALFTIDSRPYDVTLSVGGNLFDNTSVFTEFMINRNQYTYNQAHPKVGVDSSEWRLDVLLEHDFGGGYTLGLDGYYADRSDKYNIEYQLPEQTIIQQYNDDTQAVGMDLMASRTFFFDVSFNVPLMVRLDYNLSYWRSKGNEDTVSRYYQNLALSQAIQWRFDLQSVLSLQYVDFPDDYFVLTEYIQDVYFLSAELNYRFTQVSQFSLGWQRLEFGTRSNIVTWSFRFEYQFGLDESKRRARQYRVPKPIYRIRGLLH